EADAREEAAKEYDAFAAATRNLKPMSYRLALQSMLSAADFEAWDKTEDRSTWTPEQVETFARVTPLARERTRNSPFTQAVSGLNRSVFGDPVEDYKVFSPNPREEFIQEAGDNAYATFAILHDFEWLERGKMGWF